MKWAVTCIAVLACVGFASALKCYTCENAGECANDMFQKDDSRLEACDTTPAPGATVPPYAACIKRKFSNGQVKRGCVTAAECPGGDTDSCDSAGNICCCTGVGCNSATTRRVSYTIIAATLVLTWMAKVF